MSGIAHRGAGRLPQRRGAAGPASSRTSARPSARSAPRATRSAPPWSPARAPAPPTTSTGASTSPAPTGGDPRCLRPPRAHRSPGPTARGGPLGPRARLDLPGCRCATAPSGRWATAAAGRCRPSWSSTSSRPPSAGACWPSSAMPPSSRLGGARLAFSTDSFVVRPLFFPGGSIGDLAVNGTVNDLAMSGAAPAYLSCGFILEEGLELSRRSAGSPRPGQGRARRPGSRSSTGDTKVVESGHGDGVYINTAGIGLIPDGVDIRPQRVGARRRRDRQRPDRRCTAWRCMSVREGLEFGVEIESDTRRRSRPRRRDARGQPGPPCPARPHPRRSGRRRSTRSPGACGAGHRIVERAIPVPAAGRQRLRDPRPRPAVRRQRGQAGRLRRRASTPRRCSAAMRAHPLGAEACVIGEVRRRAPRHGRRPHRASAAPASSTCRSASSCPGSAEPPSAWPAHRAGPGRSAPGAPRPGPVVRRSDQWLQASAYQTGSKL